MLTDLHTWGVLPLALPVADANQVRSGQAGNPDSSWCTPNGVDLFIYLFIPCKQSVTSAYYDMISQAQGIAYSARNNLKKPLSPFKQSFNNHDVVYVPSDKRVKGRSWNWCLSDYTNSSTVPEHPAGLPSLHRIGHILTISTRWGQFRLQQSYPRACTILYITNTILYAKFVWSVLVRFICLSLYQSKVSEITEIIYSSL